MRSLLPEPGGPVDLAEVYSSHVEHPVDRPFVRVNMISTLDGAIAFGGRSGEISGPADKRVFGVLRSLADVVLIGAGTLREEDYGPVRLSSDVQSARRRRGQSSLPPVAVVTRAADLGWGRRLFTSDGPAPLVITAAEAAEVRLRGAAAAVEVITARGPAGGVDLPAAMQALHQRGLRHVLCEGGPGLNTSMAGAGLVNELCHTLSPKLAGWRGQGLVGGWLGSPAPGAGTEDEALAGLAQLAEFGLVHVLEEDGFLFVRLRAS